MSNYKQRLLELAESFRKIEHDECEDVFYSCPCHPNYRGSQGRDFCLCGLEENNKRVDELIFLINKMEQEND